MKISLNSQRIQRGIEKECDRIYVPYAQIRTTETKKVILTIQVVYHVYQFLIYSLRVAEGTNGSYFAIYF